MKDIVRGECSIRWVTRSTVDINGVTKTYKKPITFPVLWIDGKLAMSASPQEKLMMKEGAKGARGNALVGGLGLGLVLEYLRPKCESITVVEKNPNVTELYKAIRKPGKPLYDRIIHDTIENVLKRTESPRWDYIFVDTWFDGDYEYLPHLNWLEQKAHDALRPRGMIRMWHKEGMVKHYLKECRQLFHKKLSIQGAANENVVALCNRYPLAGGFVAWLKQNIRATIHEAEAKALSLASYAEPFTQPLELVDELRAAGL